MVFFYSAITSTKGSQLKIVNSSRRHPQCRALVLSTWLAKSADYTGQGTRDRGYNGAGRLASSMIEGGRWHTQVAFGFWGGIDWKPLAFAKGLGRGRAGDGAVLQGRFGGL